MRRLICLLASLLFLLCPAAVGAVSVSDAVDFVPVEAVPDDVDIPDFYTRVENSAGLYIFMTADGTVHKRIYGSVEGVYGWFVAHGMDNIVTSPTPDADIDADRALYSASPWVYTGTTTSAPYVGILPPQEGVTSVTQIFGFEPRSVFRAAAVTTIALCLIILIASSGRKH